MLRRVPPDEAYEGAMGFSPWGSTFSVRSKINMDVKLDAVLTNKPIIRINYPAKGGKV
jgi:hypothetical protein